jgi:hypothetical protein
VAGAVGLSELAQSTADGRLMQGLVEAMSRLLQAQALSCGVQMHRWQGDGAWWKARPSDQRLAACRDRLPNCHKL